LEGEALLLGIWKNIADLEENLTLEELELIVTTKRNTQYEDRKFAAALKGIDLDKNNPDSAQAKLEEIRKRAKMRNEGMTQRDIEREELKGVGVKISYED
jgi:hypothetical protein